MSIDDRYLQGRMRLDLDLLVLPTRILEMSAEELEDLRERLVIRREQLFPSSEIFRPMSNVLAFVTQVQAMRQMPDVTETNLQTACDIEMALYGQRLREIRCTLRRVVHRANQLTPRDVPELTDQEVLDITAAILDTPSPTFTRSEGDWQAPWDSEPEEYVPTRRRRRRLEPIDELPVNLPETVRPEDAPPTYEESLAHPVLENAQGKLEHPNTTGYSEEIVRPPPYDPITVDIENMHISSDGHVFLKGLKIKIPPNTPSEFLTTELTSVISRLFSERSEAEPSTSGLQNSRLNNQTDSSTSSDESSD